MAVLIALLGLLPTALFAQETVGSIRGSVTDPTGSAVTGAKVEISGSGLPQPLTVMTDSTGGYAAVTVPVGIFSVSATAPGFSTMRKADVSVVVGRTTRVDFRMEVGQVSESVVVNAEAVVVDTSSSSSAVAVDRQFFDILPKARGFDGLIAIAPGARSEGKSGGYQVDGASGSESTFYLGGMEVTDIRGGTLSDRNKVPVEAVEQVQIKNGVMDAEYGGAMGGVVSAVMRSGSNDFHGQVGFYYDNDTLSARTRPTLQLDPTDPDNNTAMYLQNKLDSWQNWNPVVTVGGPVIKNKLFFFAGFMPTMKYSDRTVTFTTGQTGSYSSKYMQQYLPVKLDYVPAEKLRVSMSWIWNPNRTTGVLPARDGTGAYNSDWANMGQRTAGNVLSGQVDYTATSKLIFTFRGGYDYTNYNSNYGIQDSVPFLWYNNSNLTSTLNIPNDLRRNAGALTPNNQLTYKDIYTRINMAAHFTYMANAWGQHTIKGGWQMNRLSNSPNASLYPSGYYRFYWNTSYSCVTSQCDGRVRGTYGYYRYRYFATTGDVSSNNHAIFLQDTWRVNKHLTLNLGLRTEHEFVPSYTTDAGYSSQAITFDWPSKMSPRVGASFDPTGTGKMKLYGSWGFFYDIMKYSLPRGSFGGDKWVDYFFGIDDPNVVRTLTGNPANPPATLPGKFFESVNWRLPSNDAIDPSIKPMKQSMFDIGYEYSFQPTLVGALRYTNRRLIRTIEDIGTLTPEGEGYIIGNPGFGQSADPKNWATGIPPTQKAKRNYDAIELRIDKRFAKNYQFTASYTWSRTYGNYSGLASSDEPSISGGVSTGRTDPNVNRYFDLPWVGYTQNGQLAEGLLATDRPHTFKFFGGYTLKSKLGNTTLSPSFMLYSGTPLTSQGNVVSSVPMYFYGRGDLGRTPIFANIDFNLMHEFKPLGGNERFRTRFEFTVFNLLNSSTVMDRFTSMIHSDDGQLDFPTEASIFKGFDARQMILDQFGRYDPRFNMANAFQSPRTARLQLSFSF